MTTLSRLVRCWLVCLMVLVLPVQGIAAATRLHCGSAGAGGTLALHTAAALDAGAHAAHHPAGRAAPHATETDDVSHDYDSTHHASSRADGQDAASAGTSGAGESGCSACAACCAGMALAAAMPSVPSPALSGTVFASRVPRIVARPAAGPERPPRAFSA